MSDPTLGGDDTRPLPPPPPASAPAPPTAASYPPPRVTTEAALPLSDPEAGDGPGTIPSPPTSASKKKRAWLLPTAVGVVALLVGMGIGAVSAQSTTKKAKDELAAVTSERDDLQSQVDDRAAQTEADKAAAQKLQSENDAADRKAAEDKAAADKAAADKAAADQAAADKAASDQAAAAFVAEAAKNTIPGSGIFEIGGDKNPGTYRTSGPDGRSCYYAVLSSPNGSGVDNIIDNNIIDGPGIVTLRAGQYFESKGCNDWTRS